MLEKNKENKFFIFFMNHQIELYEMKTLNVFASDFSVHELSHLMATIKWTILFVQKFIVWVAKNRSNFPTAFSDRK